MTKPSKTLTWAGVRGGTGVGVEVGSGAGEVAETFGDDHFGGDPQKM